MQMPEVKLTKTHYIIIAVLVLAFVIWRVVTVLMPKPASWS
jgi:hypothetical protein